MESGNVSADLIIENMKWPRKFGEAEGRVLYALRNYQTIELVLKAFLSNPLNDGSPPADDVKEVPLGRLIRKFKQLNGNAALHSALAEILKDRNRIAHQALILQDQSLARSMGFEPVSLTDIRFMDSRAQRAMTDLICEFIRIQSRAS